MTIYPKPILMTHPLILMPLSFILSLPAVRYPPLPNPLSIDRSDWAMKTSDRRLIVHGTDVHNYFIIARYHCL